MLSARGTEEPAKVSATVAEIAGQTGVEIIKPERDDRDYRYIKLPNGLSAVVISDSHTETSAASMWIRVGHMQDPEELAGMAHFHEHSKSVIGVPLSRKYYFIFCLEDSCVRGSYGR